MNIQECYPVGYVSKTHGLKGEVTVVFKEPIELEGIESVFIEINGNLVPYFIAAFSDRGDKAFIKFEDISTPEEAANLKGSLLYLAKSVRPALKRGQFYNDEVVGFTIEDEFEGVLGILKQVVESGPTRLLEIDYQGKEVLIPINGPFIKSVNKTKKLIKVSLPEGFLSI